jgi:anti-sigma B factor antagonist
MRMEVTVQRLPDCDVVKATGRIDSATAPMLEETFEAIIEGGRTRIVFDMSEVSFISSVGLRAMIDAQKACRQVNGGEMVVAGLPPLISKAFDLAGYHLLFKVYETVEEAVAGFGIQEKA